MRTFSLFAIVILMSTFVVRSTASVQTLPAPQAVTDPKQIKSTPNAQVEPKSLTIEITGNESKVEKFLGLMKAFGVLDLTRTGKVALPRK